MNKKFSAAAIGGSISTILVWVLGEFVDVHVPAEVAAAVGALCTYAASALIPDEVEA